MRPETELLEIGVGFLETRKYQKAIEFFSQAIEMNATSSEAFELRGIAHFRLFEIEEAINDTSKSIEIDTNNHRAWYNKGEILKYKHKYEEAEHCYRHANELYPESFFYLTGLIQATLAQKKYERTIFFCNQILKESPADAISLYSRGSAYGGQLDYDAAIKDFLKLIEIGKRTPTNYNNLGFWYGKIGEIKKAYNNLSISLQLNPTHPYALNNMGFVKYLEGDLKKALELFDNALGIDPSNSYAYKNRALVFLKLDKKESALNDLLKAKSLGYGDDYDGEVDNLLRTEYNKY